MENNKNHIDVAPPGRSGAARDQWSIQRTVHGQTARLILTTPAKSYVFEYAMPETFAFDFTAGAEDEHFDFGLFVINISGDSQRAARMYPDESRTTAADPAL